MNIIKFLFFGLPLIFLLHFETLSFGWLKLSHAWKAAALLIILCLLFKNGKAKLYFYWPIFILSILSIVGFELVNNPVNALVTFFSLLLLTFLGAYIQTLSPDRVKSALLFFAFFVIISFIPYELGLLTSLTDGYDLSGYGVIDQKGIIGPFQTVHAASSVLACALLVILFFYFKGLLSPLCFFPAFLLGIYFLLFTYVRTGMAMFIAGAIPIIFHFVGWNIKNWAKLSFFVATFAIIVSFIFIDNSILVNRISGERIYYSEDSIETYGSGRVLFAITTIDYYLESHIVEQLVGLGETQGLNRMQDKIGVALFPHNGFLFLLSSAGIIGLSLFIVFLFKLYKNYKKSRSENSILAKSIFIAYLVMVIFQSYELLYVFVFLALSFSYLKDSYNLPALKNPRNPHEHWFSGVFADGRFSQFDFQ